MLPDLIFHIRQFNNIWRAKADKKDLPTIESVHKPDVVRRAAETAKKLASNALIIIHGLDGRILEQRHIQNNNIHHE